MSKCKISEVTPLSKISDGPILVHFQNGSVLPSNGDMDDDDKLECLLARNERDQLHAIVATGDNVYTGRVGDGFAGDLVRNFIGIRNRVTNKIRLIEVEQCSMLGKHYQVDPAELAASQPKVNNAESAQAYKTMLKSFGGKAANRMLEKKEKMRVNVDVVREQLDKTMNESLSATVVDGNDGDVAAKDAFDVAQAEREETIRAMVPKLNEQAKRLEDVYRLGDLIDSGLLKNMDSDAVAVLNTDLADLPIKTGYLLNIIKQCQQSENPESPANMQRIKVCIYVDALINFLRGLRNSRQNMKEANFSDIAERVESDIRRVFRQPDTQRIIKSNYIQHKAICYVVILSLIASENFELDTVHLVEAVHIPKTQLYTLLAMVPVRRKPKVDTLVLKLPSQLRLNAAPKKQFVRSRRTM